MLGIDLGTTYSAAAIMRGSTVEPCVLGTIAAQIPSVVVHRENSEILTGEAAERRAASEPTRTAREFKRRLGDPVPIIVGGTPYGAEALMAEMLDAIVRQVTQREGEPPTTIVLTHPANYSEYKRGLLREAARLAGLDLDRVRLITEPEAAAIAYAHQQRIDPGEIIAVYDFGGGTFDAAVVRDTADGFELIGTPEGMERLGGIDFDQAVLFHVDTVLDGMVSAADGSDPQVLAGQARLRDECRRAKEALSNDTDATIAVSIPGVQTDVRLTRDELEQMVRPRIAETVKALQRAIASAGIAADDVSRVLLVGGSSRMPIVAQVVRESIGRPVSTDADPKLAIAIGAALSAAPTLPVTVGAVAPTQVVVRPLPPGRPRSVRRLGIAAAAVAGVVAAATIVILTRSDDSIAKPSAVATSLPATIPAGTVGAQGASTTVTALSSITLDPPPATTPSTTAATTPVNESTSVPAAGDAAARLAFDGSDQGSGIPGPATSAGAPGALGDLVVAPNGDVYIATVDFSVVKVSGGIVEAVAEFAASDVPVAGVALGLDGAVFVATPAGIVRVNRGVRELVLDGPASGLSGTLGPLTSDAAGNLYIADNGTSRVLRLASDGELLLVAGTGTAAVAGSLAVDGSVAVETDIGTVTSLVVDRAGNLLIADATLHTLRAVAHDGTITTVAGGGSVGLDTFAGAGAAANTSAIDLSFIAINDVAVDRQGRIYVADSARGVIVRFGSDGIAQRVLGGGPGSPTPSVTNFALAADGAVVFSDGLVLWSVAPVGEAG